MFSDGLIGGKGAFDSIAPLTAAIFNYLRAPNTPATKPADIFPWVVDYEKNPEFDVVDSEQINNSLLTFLTQSPGFSMDKINDKSAIQS